MIKINIKTITKKLMQHSAAALIVTSLLTSVALAAGPDITTGLDNVDAPTFAGKVMKIAIGVGALDGVAAAGMLILLGMKLKGVGQKGREETLDHLKWVFIGLGVVGLASIIIGFAAYLIKSAQ